MKISKSIQASVVGTLLISGALVCSHVNANPDGELPQAQTQGAVTYVSGGIGDSEASAMEHAKSQYPLSMEFVQHASARNEYMADVAVKVTDASGNVVLDTTSNGPFLLASVPSGKYKISAVDESGRAIVKHVTVSSDKHEHVMLVWS